MAAFQGVVGPLAGGDPMNRADRCVQVVDSHTGGEPTRVVVAGGPDLGEGPVSERAGRFAQNFDAFRRMLIAPPRGAESMVGALLCEPTDPSCAAGVIFFNNRGYLGMCGHGAIGVAVTLAYLGRLKPGRQRLETPVGTVAVEVIHSNEAAVENVPCYRLHSGICVDIEGVGSVTGDVAWGGNWFFIVNSPPASLAMESIAALREAALRVRRRLRRQRIRGADGAEIDHIAFFGPAADSDASSRNFVLCPGGAYDRSPCGTGTCAKLACLAADGRLEPGEVWVQESIIGARFSASYRTAPDGRIIPTIRGAAFVYGVGELIVQSGDPFPEGMEIE